MSASRIARCDRPGPSLRYDTATRSFAGYHVCVLWRGRSWVRVAPFVAAPDGTLICDQRVIRAAEVLSEQTGGLDAPESVRVEAAGQRLVIRDLRKQLQRLTDENEAIERELVAVRVNRQYPSFDAHTALTARAQLAQSLRDARAYLEAAVGFNAWAGEDEALGEAEILARQRVGEYLATALEAIRDAANDEAAMTPETS